MSKNGNKAKVTNHTATSNNKYYITTSCGYGRYIYIATDETNCKLSYIHNVGSLCRDSSNVRKEIIDAALTLCKGAVIINTTIEEVSDWIAENYDVYYYNKVPIGYNSGFQYHICIKNSVNVNAYCKKAVVRIKKAINQQELSVDSIKISKEALSNKLLEKLKLLRRKNDYVNDFINEL